MNKVLLGTAVSSILLLAGCSTTQETKALSNKVDALSEQVSALSSQISSMNSNVTEASSEAERANARIDNIAQSYTK
jgi:murein lipoprotein